MKRFLAIVGGAVGGFIGGSAIGVIIFSVVGIARGGLAQAGSPKQFSIPCAIAGMFVGAVCGSFVRTRD